VSTAEVQLPWYGLAQLCSSTHRSHWCGHGVATRPVGIWIICPSLEVAKIWKIYGIAEKWIEMAFSMLLSCWSTIYIIIHVYQDDTSRFKITHIYIYMYVCMYGWMDACMHACMHVCMYVCVYIYMYVYMHTYV
jgi:hypothetical protein